MNSGIYTITCLVNNKIYVGYTTDFSKRMHFHFRALKGGYHRNQHLQAAFKQYGEKNFSFEILVECPEHLLASEEHYWATLLDVHNDKYGYNIQPTHPNNLLRVSAESRRKGAEKMKGRKRNNYNWKGRKHTPESREKQRLAKLGKRSNKTTACKISKLVPIPGKGFRKRKKIYNRTGVVGRPKGCKHTQKAIEKIRQRSSQPDNKERIRTIQEMAVKANTGRKRTLEQRLKMSIGRRKNPVNRVIDIYDNKTNSLFDTCTLIPEAEEKTGVSKSCIRNNLYGFSKSTTLFTFKFREVA